MTTPPKPRFNDPRIERLLDLAERGSFDHTLMSRQEYKALRWAIGMLRSWPEDRNDD